MWRAGGCLIISRRLNSASAHTIVESIKGVTDVNTTKTSWQARGRLVSLLGLFSLRILMAYILKATLHGTGHNLNKVFAKIQKEGSGILASYIKLFNWSQ